MRVLTYYIKIFMRNSIHITINQDYKRKKHNAANYKFSSTLLQNVKNGKHYDLIHETHLFLFLMNLVTSAITATYDLGRRNEK